MATTTMSQPRDPSCIITGNSDLYGLGIRDTNAIFVVAVFLATLWSTVTGQLRDFEAFVTLQMMFAFLLSVLSVRSVGMWKDLDQFSALPTSFEDLMKAHMNVSDLGAAFRLLLSIAVSCYNVWFWFKGVDVLIWNDCESYMFFFTKVSMDGWAVKVFKVYAIDHVMRGIELFLPIILLTSKEKRSNARKGWEVLKATSIQSLPKLLWDFYRRLNTPKDYMLEAIEASEKAAQTKNSPYRNLLRVGNEFEQHRQQIRVLWRLEKIVKDVAIIGWSIAAIELTLAYNSVQGVYGIDSTGQLIPFIIGVLGLLRVLNLIIVTWKSEVGENAQRAEKPSISRTLSSGIFKYLPRNNRSVQFAAQTPARRWSFDLSAVEKQRRSSPDHPAPVDIKDDQLAPYRYNEWPFKSDLPVLWPPYNAWLDHSTIRTKRQAWPRPEWRWHPYTDISERQLRRRWSYDDCTEFFQADSPRFLRPGDTQTGVKRWTTPESTEIDWETYCYKRTQEQRRLRNEKREAKRRANSKWKKAEMGMTEHHPPLQLFKRLRKDKLQTERWKSCGLQRLRTRDQCGDGALTNRMP